MTYSFFDSEKIISHKNFSSLSFWQGEKWKNILQKSTQAREVFYFGNPEKTFLQIEIRSVGAGFFGAFSLGVKNFQISDDFSDFFAELSKVLQEKNCIFFQIEPLETSEILENFFKNQKTGKISKKFLMPFTRVISLSDTVDEILLKMPQKGRYAVRNAEKQGVEVKLLSKIDDEHFDAWMSLLDETTKRDNFSHNSREYYKNFLSELSGEMAVAAAHYKGKIVAMAISVFSGEDAVYYYGASTSEPEGRKVSASYLLLWRTMELAREKWCKNYDLLGVADPNDPNDPLLGVSNFKQKLGGELVELPNKFLAPLSWKYQIFAILQKMKKIFKK